VTNKNETRAVLFDLDETLVPETDPITEAYTAVSRAVWGAHASTDHLQSVRIAARGYWEAHSPHLAYTRDVHMGPSDGLSSSFEGPGQELADLRAFLPEFRAHVFDSCLPPDYRGAPGELREVWWRARMRNRDLYPGAHELLATLRNSYKLALVTNGASDFQRQKIEHFDLAHRFDALVVSGDLGTGKPNAAPFLAALEALDVSAVEAVMIGNDQDRDIAGAQALGIRTIWVQPGDPSQQSAVTDLTRIPALLAA
jgi:putative hydrolase of the HAD superfamily